MPKDIRLNSRHYFIMKISNKRELEQIVFNHSSDIEVKGFINLYNNDTAKPYPYLVIDGALAPSCFRKNLLEKIQKSMTAADDNIRDEKLQHDIDRDAGKISALSSSESDKHEHLIGEEILPSNKR